VADNTVTVVGNITRDPELRFTQGGKGIASFGLAVNRRYQQNGEWQEKVSFFNVTAWDQLGENAAASLAKGTRVIVTGRLEQREYETQQGEKRNVVEIVADEIGPSLRWARANVERVVRSSADGGQGGGGYSGGGGGGGQGGGYSGGGSGGGGGGYGGGRAADPVYGDEEPF
jgi:single-strand DNA-binding protein